MTNPTIVDSGSAVSNQTQLVITTTIQQDAAAMNLTGKTVTATVRRESDHATVIHADLEDHAVTVTTAASGIVTLTLLAADMQKLTVAANPWESTPYLVAFKVVEDSYYPQPYRLHVHGVLD